jgi:UDP-N-acetyl-D-glucosamine dehydrogenase
MPEYTVSILQDLLNEKGHPIKGTRIAVLGVAYKRNVDDPRESPFYKLRDILLKKGAVLSVFDSWVTSENTVQSLDECIEGAKAIVIVTEHSDVIEKLSNIELGDSDIEVVVDGRNCLDGDRIRNQNVLYRGIGR